jgi:hypothetical protein
MIGMRIIVFLPVVVFAYLIISVLLSRRNERLRRFCA